ncbi:MAG TPA: hypothetical protein GX010_03670 [Erysipelotrichaceae bacterium]|nr:hypothetical protein [Erysipelotrichaceae bacterium]
MNFIELIKVPIRPIRKFFLDYVLKYKTEKEIKKGITSSRKKIYYIGIPAHANLGDLAQGMCIRRWLKKNYPEYYIVEIETNALVNTHLSLINRLKNVFNNERDFVVFQSGYTTTDLGGHADLMHQAVMKALPNARILMMPQTIFFKTEERKMLCSKIYNAQKNMLFLARDSVSYSSAKEMFPDIAVKCFPDIVTTLIGYFNSKRSREGICFCLRNDKEKFFSDEELQVLIDRCKEIGRVNRVDTTKKKKRKAVKNAEKYIFLEIEEYSKYKLMITDRYHGTIFSLVAGTPVIVIRTTDHKVTTGAEWFKGIYDNHVFLAKNLKDAYEIAKSIYARAEYPALMPFFEKEYYDKLPKLFEETTK